MISFTTRTSHACTPSLAVLALATAPDGFTVGQLAAKVQTMTGHTENTIRHAAYDLRKLRGKRLIDKPRPIPPLPATGARRLTHHRPAQPPRPRHRPNPARSTQPVDGS